MKYLPKSEAAYDAMIAKLAIRTEREVKKQLQKLLKGHLKNRTVKFVDAMGSTTVDISSRHGGWYIINSCDVWLQGAASYEVNSFTWVDEVNSPWMKPVMDLISEYNEIAERHFAVEFELSF